LRLAEVCSLRWAWIVENEIRFPCDSSFQTKSGREESVYLTLKARAVLLSIDRRRENVFICPKPMQVD
jgi:hypothetical protein